MNAFYTVRESNNHNLYGAPELYRLLSLLKALRAIRSFIINTVGCPHPYRRAYFRLRTYPGRSFGLTSRTAFIIMAALLLFAYLFFYGLYTLPRLGGTSSWISAQADFCDRSIFWNRSNALPQRRRGVRHKAGSAFSAIEYQPFGWSTIRYFLPTT